MEPAANAHLGAIQRLADAAAKAPDLAPLYESLLARFVDAVDPDQAALALYGDDGEIGVVATHRLLDTYRTAAPGNCPWPTGTTPAQPPAARP